MSKSILFDSALCIGCGACKEACDDRNGLQHNKEEKISNNAISILNEYNIDNNITYYHKFCMHCINPECLSVCLDGALIKTEIGAVIYDEKKCKGCGYCMSACPFETPRYQSSENSAVIKKCDMCYEKIIRGGVPECVEVCPSGAGMFGERDTLLKYAHERISSESGLFLYGEKEAGGLSTLIISNVSPDKLGLPMNLSDKAAAPLWVTLTNLHKYMLYGGAIAGGVYWITKRRKDVAEFEKKSVTRMK